MKCIDYSIFIQGEPYSWYWYCPFCERLYENDLKSQSRFLRIIEDHHDKAFHLKNVYKKSFYNSDDFKTDLILSN